MFQSTQDNSNLFQQLKSGFKRTSNWNNYQSDPKTSRKPYLNHLVDPSFHGVNRLFAVSLENENGRLSHSDYYLSQVETKDYNIKIDVKNVCDQPINNDIKTYENIRKIATGQGDDHKTGCLLGHPYFKENYKMIVIDLSKQQALDSDPRSIQEINITVNLDRAGNTTMFFIIKEGKENVLDFSERAVKVL